MALFSYWLSSGVHLFMTRYILMSAVSKIGRVFIVAHKRLLRL